MKKLFSLGLASLLGTCAAMAAPVSPDRAAMVAKGFLSSLPDAAASLTVSNIEKLGNEVYIVNFSPCGYVMVSADDNTSPVISFSPTNNITEARMPENMRHMVGESRQAVKMQMSLSAPDANWAKMEKGDFGMSRANDQIEPLIKVNWSQSNPFNTFCPGEGSNKALVGCVAVAMSQAMSVQQYPPRPVGQKKYSCAGYGTLSINFDNEAPYDWDAIMAGSNNRQEVARLLYHAGMGVEMSYGADGSGVPTNQLYRIVNALRENFGYGSEVTLYRREQYKDDWDQMLINELSNSRAVIYNAVDSENKSGHSFNIDGYRYQSNANYYHVNWGWGESYNSYYLLSALRDGNQNYNYDASHVVVVGIGAPDAPLRSIALSDMEIEAGTPKGSVVSTVLINGAPADPSMHNVTITGEWISGSSYGKTPFQYKDGLLYSTEEFTEPDTHVYVRIAVSMKDGSGNPIAQGFNIKIVPVQSLEHKTSLNYDRASQTFTVHTKFGAHYELKDATGATVMSGDLQTLPTFTFSRRQLKTGVNTLVITSGDQTKSLNITI